MQPEKQRTDKLDYSLESTGSDGSVYNAPKKKRNKVTPDTASEEPESGDTVKGYEIKKTEGGKFCELAGNSSAYSFTGASSVTETQES